MNSFQPDIAPDTIYSLQGEDRKGFSFLYNLYYLRIFYFIQKFVDNAQEAEDITADCFVKLWQYSQANAIKNVKSFLHVTARNACLDHLKAKRTHSQKENEISWLAEQESRSNFQLAEIKAEVLQEIYAEIEKLPNTSKEVFKLSFIEGMKNSEIATLLNLSEQTVYNQKAMALKGLRLAMRDKEWIFLIAMLVVNRN